MKRGSTLFLKTALILMALPVIAFCIVALPFIVKEVAKSSLNWTYLIYGILVIMTVSVIPYIIGLVQAFKLLNYIDKNEAFSELSVHALKIIKRCALTISAFYIVGMPLFYIVAELDDAPGVILIGMVLIFASLVISVFAAVLQRLLQEAINIKSENDLTV